jgi:mannosylglycerate hydrolase
LRSIGLISRSANRWREDPAGPEIAIPAAQLRGPQRFAFAWSQLPLERAPAAAETYRLPFLALPGSSRAGESREQEGVRVRNAMLSSLRRRDGELEARIVNAGASPVTSAVGDEQVPLGPWEIRSVRFSAAGLGGGAGSRGARSR